MTIVCASKSRPDLRPEPFSAAKLDTQLDAASSAYLHNATKGLMVEGDNLRVSRIFDCFAKDFEAAGGVGGFIRRYWPDLPDNLPIRADLPYDWSLNGE